MTVTKVDPQFNSQKGTRSRAAPVVIANLISAAVAVTIARPANTTAYAAKDMVGVADASTPANAGSAILKFSDIGNKGGIVKIVGADLRVDLAAVPASMAAFTLHLYDAAPDAKLDNAAFDVSSAGDRAKYLGSIDLGTPGDIGSTLFIEKTALTKQVRLAADSSDLYGVLVTEGGYTPTSGEVLAVRLQVENRA